MRAALTALLVIALPWIPSRTAGAAAQDTTTLQFRGFRAGARLDALAALVRREGSGRLRCARAKRDPRVSECRGTVRDSAVGPIHVWVSAIDSTAGVITLSAAVDSSGLTRWRRELERRYGVVPARPQGNQSMLQWVRRGRMLRLTWRRDRGELTASVSLVDGRVLDAWGADRAAGSP